jgi:hypothetical protein
MKDKAWLALQAVGTRPLDLVETPSGPFFDLFGNAGEITQFQFRPYPGHPEPDAYQGAHWLGHVVRSGIMGGLERSNPTPLGYPLGYLRRGTLPPDLTDRFIGFRCARSVRPILVQYLSSPLRSE